MSKHRWITGVGGFAIVTIAAALVLAQNTNDPQQPRARNPAAGDQTGGAAAHKWAGLDHYFVDCLIKGNQKEIEFARVAQQRSSNPDVKKFAAHMIDDHTKFANKLREFGGTSRMESETGRRPLYSRSAPRTTPGTNQPTFQGQSQPQLQGGLSRRHMAAKPAVETGHAAREFVRIMDDVAQQFQQSFLRELSQKEGVQFDRCYMMSQVLEHQWMVDAMGVFEQHASNELRPILQEGVQTAQAHLTHAKQLLAQLEQGHARRSAARSPESSFRK